MPARVAQSMLEEHGYKVAKVAGRPTANRALVGKVAAQEHPPGHKLPKGETVRLQIWVAAVRPAAAP